MKDPSAPAAQPDTDTSTNRLASGAGLFMVGSFAGRGFLVVSQVLIARLLGAEQYGLYALGWTVLRMVGVIAIFGMNSGVIRFGAPAWPHDRQALKNVVSQTMFMALVTSSVIGLLVALNASVLSTRFFNDPRLTPVLVVFGLTFPLHAGLKVAASATQVSKTNRYMVYAEELGRPFFQLILVGAALALGVGLLGVVVATALSFVLSLALAIYYIIKIFPNFLSTPRTEPLFNAKILSFALPTTLVNTVTFTNSRIDLILIGYFLLTADAGIYQAVIQILLVFTIIQISFSSIFSPMIADLFEQGQLTRLNELYTASTKWAFYISLPIFTVFVLLSQDVITVFFGGEYASQAAVMALTILGITEIFNVSTGAVGPLLIYTDHARQWLAISLVALTSNIALNILLIPQLGLPGAALASAVGISLLFALGVVYVRHKLRLWPYNRRYLKGIGAALLAGGVLYVAQPFLPGGVLLRLLLGSSLVSVVYIGALLVLRLDAEDQAFIAFFVARFRDRLRA